MLYSAQMHDAPRSSRTKPDEEPAGRSFYVVLKNNISATDDRVLIQV